MSAHALTDLDLYCSNTLLNTFSHGREMYQ